MNRTISLVLLWALLAAHAAGQDRPAIPTRIVTAARGQVGVTTTYDPSYVALAYPNGDVPARTGVCADVVIRALRAVAIDLQQEIHEDMRSAFEAYPQKWGLKKPDRNIDHRRVPNLMRYFERKHVRLGEKLQVANTYASGDIVAWDLGGGILHIGIVSDRKAGERPLVIHNIGSGAQEEDILFKYRVIGHYRVKASTHP